MKTILITGSSRGIGKAIAELAHKQGYRVIIHGRTDSEQLDKLHTDLKDSIKTHFDIADKNATHKAINEVLDKVNNIDVLVNNAGVAKNFLADISEVEDELAIEEFNTNILGTIHCIQAVLPKMIENKSGSVINMASIKGYPQLSTLSTLTYATTKAGVISLTKSLAKKYAEFGIRFNSVSPGYTKTDQVDDWNEETFRRINEGTLAGRMASVEEIAKAVLFLASEDSSYVNGTDLLVDGGYMLKGK